MEVEWDGAIRGPKQLHFAVLREPVGVCECMCACVRVSVCVSVCVYVCMCQCMCQCESVEVEWDGAVRRPKQLHFAILRQSVC